jgi:hypothetical protein
MKMLYRLSLIALLTFKVACFASAQNSCRQNLSFAWAGPAGVSPYSYSGVAITQTSTTVVVPCLDTTNTLYAFAYDEKGHLVSQRWRSVTTREGGDPYGTLGYNISALLFERINIRKRLLEDILSDLP